MIHHDKQNNTYSYTGYNFILLAYSLQSLIQQAKDIYNVDLYTLLN